MSEITIGRPTQALLLLGFIAGIGALVAAQMPEIKRYLKIVSM